MAKSPPASPRRKAEALRSITDGVRLVAGKAKVVQTPLNRMRSLSQSITKMRTGVASPGFRSIEESNDDDGDDMARPANTAESFVSLLTTATMYNGNLQELNPDASLSNDEQGLEQESIESNEPLPFSPSMEVSHSQNQTDSIEEIPDADQSESVSSPPKVDRRPSLFQLSVERKLSSNNTSAENKIDNEKRIIALTEKLKKSFGIKEDDTFVADYPCWILKDVLLQGHMYLTQSHLMFFAFLPKTEKEKPSMVGNLSMEVMPSMRLVRYYAVLQGHTLSFFNKSTDLYFPVLTIDLKNVIRVEIIGDSFTKNKGGTWIKILTESKTHKFQADSQHNARSWVGFLRKHVFSSRNRGDEVTIKLPLQNILSVERDRIFEATETIKLKVLENLNSFVYDDYFFMFFNSGPEVYESLNLAMQKRLNDGVLDDVIDSTAAIKLETKKVVKKSKNPLSPLKQVLGSTNQSSNDNTINPTDPSLEIVERVTTKDGANSPPASPPPQLSSSFQFPILSGARQTIGRFTPRVFKSASSMWNSNPTHYTDFSNLGEQDEFLIRSEKDRITANERFREHFSLSESHELVSTYYAYLNKNIPIYGKVYLSNHEICFRSLLPGTNTVMILPLTHLETIYKEKGFKFGFSGLVLVISGHEELFLEFSWSEARDDCEWMILKEIDAIYNSIEADNSSLQRSISSSRDLEAAKIRLFEDKIYRASGLDVPVIIEDHPLLKTKLEPGKQYRFGLLTIGSRGDVQPYIALGLALIKEGHSVTIMTHIEFKDWIEKHGIKFKEIAGNPTELMSLMVQHGSMNVGLLREASSNFRGWITELLSSSWEASKDGYDVLIESPSAMAGIHIAEALGIPYFRAFTMPWTRTRAYPHAFIVPEQKKGGSYNYLTHVVFENVFWKGISSQVNKWRQETLKLPKTNLDLLQQGKVPFLYSVSPTVMPPPVDYNDWVKVTGYWFLDEKVSYEPKAEIVQFINDAKKNGKKIVYIGFGSIVVSNSKELTQAIVDAVIKADVCCILNKGWSERLNDPKQNQIEVSLPPQIYNSGSIPHDWLFPQIDAAVHHGGSGTTGATLRAGLPTVIKPFFGDQFFYANRVADIGAGVGLKKLNVETLSDALKEVTTNSRLIAKAKDIGEKISKENGVKVAIDCIYRELEYARDIILKKKQSPIKKGEEESIGEDNNEEISDFKALEKDRQGSGLPDPDEEAAFFDAVEDDGSWLLVDK